MSANVASGQITLITALAADRTATVHAGRDSGGRLVRVVELSELMRRDRAAMARCRETVETLASVELHQVVGMSSMDDRWVIGELVNAVTLPEVLAAGPLPLAASMVVATDLCAAVEELAEHGLLHGDIRPAVVLVEPTGQVLLADPGIAAPPLGPGSPPGTPTYRAPELWNGSGFTAAGDIYALTAVLVEVLSGRPPFGDPRLEALALQHARDPVPDGRVPAAARGAVLTGLAKDPRHRPASVAELRREITAAAVAAAGPDWMMEGRAQLTGRVAPLAARLPSSLVSAAEGMQAAPAGRRFRWRLVGAVVAAVLALGALLLVAAAAFHSPGGAQTNVGGAATITPSPALTTPSLGLPSALDSGSPVATQTPSPSPTSTPAARQATPAPTVVIQTAKPTPSPTSTSCAPVPTCPPAGGGAGTGTPSPSPTH